MDVTLIAETGRKTGSRPSTRLRAADKVPGVIYGLDRAPVSVVVDRKELRRALSTEAGLNALITMAVDGDEDLTIVKALQRDAVRRSVEHVDFLRVDRSQSITVEVPVVLIGEAKEVTDAQGIVEQLLHSLTISARPGSIPPHLEADVSGLEIGGAVRVGDLSLPAGVTTDVDLEEQIALGSITRAELEPTPAGDSGVDGAGAPGGQEGDGAEGGGADTDEAGD